VIAPSTSSADTPSVRPRLRPGERREQILQMLAVMLQQPGAERVTTAALARQLGVSEAALYRHFASKAQMLEGLIEFIESSVFTMVARIVESEQGRGAPQARQLVSVLLAFAEKNPGMTRVMVGDALVFENERLLVRMNQFFERFESSLRQTLRASAEQSGSAAPTAESQARASVVAAFCLGRLHRYARSGFKRLPTEHLDAALTLLIA
jgi:TetR/AcrR family transcriptional regulator